MRVESDVPGPIAQVVAQAISEAIDRSGKALALARKIQPLVGRLYANRTISAWGRGDVMPPADAAFAAAQATGVSLDGKLGIGREPSRGEQEFETLRTDLVGLDNEVGELRGLMLEFLGVAEQLVVQATSTPGRGESQDEDQETLSGPRSTSLSELDRSLKQVRLRLGQPTGAIDSHRTRTSASRAPADDRR
ncbi:MAG: hypothetical protein M3024_01410 [Candidatus Dormibacteraeota bacterium]|nr:hypothetical protein [Candidatus Dormibacteraeota bacterium]MDQ6900211.1 hypothetical protein [Candidatus Dormibacteraeota bacterium]